jgi:eukaryotic-like serine/threonine-protein kinase
MDSTLPTADEPCFSPGATVANYVIEELLGEGAEGAVFVARDSLLGRRVAMKTLRAAEVGETRGVEEARILASLEHPHIVRVYHARRHRGVWYVVYEYLPGGSLQSLVERVGALPLEQALDYAAQAAGGLSLAHRRGILHRDVKPQNLLLSSQGQVKLGDFGLAFDARSERQAGGLIGTPAFLAPEVWRGDTATAASDVFSLGACLFFLCTARLPFVGTSLEQLKQAHAELKPKLPSGLPAPVADVLGAMLDKSPANRPSSDSLPRLLEQLAAEPYATPRVGDATPSVPQPFAPFAPTGPERALREVLRSGRDVAYVTELLDLLSSAPLGVELRAPNAADALLLVDVAREVGAERRSVVARLTLPKPTTSLRDVVTRQLALRENLSFADACRHLLAHASRLSTSGLVVLHAPRGLGSALRFDVEALAAHAAAAGAKCVLATPRDGAGSEAEPPAGFRRMSAFDSSESAQELAERLQLWLRFATGDRFHFSADALRLASHYCLREGRYWASLALQSLLIASAARLNVVTTWAVSGAHQQLAPWQEPREVPAAFRQRPLVWPTDAMAAELRRVHALVGGGARSVAPDQNSLAG